MHASGLRNLHPVQPAKNAIVMHDHPKVSVAMPVYNGGHYFPQAVESVLAQTYDNVEIVIVDDGSTDGGETAENACRFVCPNVKFIQQENQGVGGAINTAIAAMSGDVFCWLSHDDLYLPHKLARQVDFFRRLGRSDAMLFSDYFLIDAEGKELNEVKLPHDKLWKKPLLSLLNGCINGCTIFIPLDILKRFEPFDSSWRYAQDYLQWNRLLREFDFFHQPETLIKYRVHPAQDTNKPGAVIEGENIWIRMMEDRTEIERVFMYRSARRFFLSLAEHLKHSSYHRAIEYAQTRAASAVDNTLVSIVVPLTDDSGDAHETIRSALFQSHNKIEVLIVGSRERLGAYPNRDARVQVVACDETTQGALLNAGCAAAAGDYLTFLRPGATRSPASISRQLWAMQEQGLLLSAEQGEQSLDVIGRDLLLGSVRPTLSSILVHRMLLVDGNVFEEPRLQFSDSAALVPIVRRKDIWFLAEAG